MGADLTYNCLGGNQYRVRLSFYRDCAGITPLSSYNITVSSVSCGQNLNMTLTLLAGYPVEVSPLCPSQLNQSTCTVGGTLPGVQQYIFEGTITLPMACTDWVFSWYECCRNSAITTLTAPASEGMTIWANLNNVAGPCNNSPDFTTFPVPYICAGQTYLYNHGAIDPDGDSLVYTLVSAMNTATVPVVYNAPYNGSNPMASTPPVTINSTNGNVTMDPTGVQVAVMTVRVDEYRNGVLIGSVMRDIQVTVLNCTNNPPVIAPITGVTGGVQTGPYSVQICPGQTLSFQVPGSDPNNGQNITMSWNNGIPGATFVGGTATAPSTVSGTFTWTPSGSDVGLHALTVTLTDNACPVIGQATIAIDIEVLAGTTAGPDIAYCTPPGTGAQLNATGGTSFTWTILSGTAGSLSCTNCANPLATPSVPTTYQVVSNLASGCKNRDTVVVSPAVGFTLTSSPDITVCQSGSTVISVTPSVGGSYTYSWSPSTSLSSGSISNPTATPPSTTTYNVTVTSAAGCSMTESVTVTMTNYQLSTTPTAVPPQACQGAPVTLNANVSSGSCEQYTVASVPLSIAGGGGWTNVAGMADEAVSAAIPLGFNFTFFCTNYTDVYVSSNGFLTFNSGSGTGCCTGQLIPNTVAPNNLIALAWDDLSPGAANNIRYKVIGAAPNRVFILEYNGVPHFGAGGGNVDGQIKLYETTNVVELHLSSMTTDGSAHTQGIENSGGTIAFPSPGRNANGGWSSTGDAYRFTPVTPPPVTITWQQPLGNTIGSGPTLNVTPLATTTYYVQITDGVCSSTGQVTVEYASVNAGPDQTICPNDNANLNAIYSGPPPPNNCNIYTIASIPFSPAAGAGTALALSDDQLSTAIPIGFTFNFFCTNYTQAYISSNGFISFDAAAGSGCCSGQVLPNTFAPNNLIAACWDDLYPPGNGSVTYLTTGVAPNRRFIVNWTSLPYCCGTVPEVTTQAILYETSNWIEFHTTSVNAASPATQGIENAGGTIGYAVAGRNSGTWSANNDAYRFTPQVIPLIWTWSPSTYLTSTTVSNPTANTVASTITYTVTVDNGTCVLTDQVTINTNCALATGTLMFDGEALQNKARLFWTTEHEEDISHYMVQRSADQAVFEDLGRVNSKSAISAENQYEFFDLSPFTGVNYYRLKLVDDDGLVSFSNAVELNFAGEPNILSGVFPNPSTGLFNFHLNVSKGSLVSIRLITISGQKVHESVYEELNGTAVVPVDISGLADGPYLYEVRIGNEVFHGKVVLSR